MPKGHESFGQVWQIWRGWHIWGFNMAEGLLGKKIGMTQIFQESGEIIPVSILQVGPCFVTQIKTEQNDGYGALQLGFDESRNLNKPQRGHLKSLPPLKYLLEVRTGDVANYQ